MPFCDVAINLAKEKIPPGFHIKLAKALSEILNKPIDRISVVVHPEAMCTRAGTEEPNAVINIWSINVFSKENNPVFGEKLVKFFTAELPALPRNRLAFCFHPIEPHDPYIHS